MMVWLEAVAVNPVDTRLSTCCRAAGGSWWWPHGAPSPELPVRALYQRDGSVMGFCAGNAKVPELATAARRIDQLLREGSSRRGRSVELPLEETAEAHRRLETGEARSRRLGRRPPA